MYYIGGKTLNNHLGYNDSIFYFNEEGKQNISKTAELSIAKAVEEGIKKILVFTGDGEGPKELKKQLEDGGVNLQIIAVSFPNLMPLFEKKEDGAIKEFFPKTSEEEMKEYLRQNNIELVQAAMPFEDVVIPGARDSKMRAIKGTLDLLSGGLKLCIQAVLMATDAGAIKPDERIISMSADTSIVTHGSNSRLLFHPTNGLHVDKIICKPGVRAF